MNEVIKNIATFGGRFQGKEILWFQKTQDKATWSGTDHTQAVTKTSWEWGSQRVRGANGTGPSGLAGSSAHWGTAAGVRPSPRACHRWTRRQAETGNPNWSQLSFLTEQAALLEHDVIKQQIQHRLPGKKLFWNINWKKNSTTMTL